MLTFPIYQWDGLKNVSIEHLPMNHYTIIIFGLYKHYNGAQCTNSLRALQTK